MDYWGPLGTIDKLGEVALFSCGMPDLDSPMGGIFGVDGAGSDREFFDATG
jgi:hypothetical protein